MGFEIGSTGQRTNHILALGHMGGAQTTSGRGSERGVSQAPPLHTPIPRGCSPLSSVSLQDGAQHDHPPVTPPGTHWLALPNPDYSLSEERKEDTCSMLGNYL